MKKLIVLIFLSLLLLLGIYAAEPAPTETIASSSYLGIEFTKPSFDYIKLTANTKTHISFGNPKNNGSPQLVTREIGIEYRLQSPGTLYMYFSSDGKAGANDGSGTSNPWMLETQDKKYGLNYYLTAISSAMPGESKDTTISPLVVYTDKKNPPNIIKVKGPFYIDQAFTEARCLDLSSNVRAVTTEASTNFSVGQYVKHHFSREDITKGIKANSNSKDPKMKGFATGTDTVIMNMAPNNLSAASGGVLKSGLYYGYIIIKYITD